MSAGDFGAMCSSSSSKCSSAICAISRSCRCHWGRPSLTWLAKASGKARFSIGYCVGARIARKSSTLTARSNTNCRDRKVNPNYTVDAVVARLEGVLVREYEKGGTAAMIKAALDRTIDQLHRETNEHRERARTAVVKAIEGGKRLTEGVRGKREE